MQALMHATVFSAIIAFFSTLLLVPLCSRLAFFYNILDIPDGNLKRHAGAIPYLGGLAVYVGFFISIFLFYPIGLPLASLLIMPLLLGFVDDVMVLKPWQKFLGQTIIAFIFVLAGYGLKTDIFSIPGSVALLSLFWISSVMNALNLVDIMDGLATTLALCATLPLCYMAYGATSTMAPLPAAFSGALLGFLWYNKPKARIYLGDAGSLCIGTFVAVAALAPVRFLPTIWHLTIPLLLLALPLMEVASLVLIRTARGIPVYQGSPDHYALNLRRKGWSPYAVLLFSLIMGLLFSLVALLYFFNLVGTVFVALSFVVLLAAWCAPMLFSL